MPFHETQRWVTAVTIWMNWFGNSVPHNFGAQSATGCDCLSFTFQWEQLASCIIATYAIRGRGTGSWRCDTRRAEAQPMQTGWARSSWLHFTMQALNDLKLNIMAHLNFNLNPRPDLREISSSESSLHTCRRQAKDWIGPMPAIGVVSLRQC